MNKIGDIVIYKDPTWFCAFPSLLRLNDGQLLLAFRRAPERRGYGGRCTHGDPNAQLVLVRSRDDGRTWSKQPELLYAHPLGGSQDPCLSLLNDGAILCTSYLWILQQPQCPAGGEYDQTGWKQTFAGGYMVRSQDGGQHWEGPILPPPVRGCVAVDAFGQPIPAHNRGNVLAARDGLLYWAAVRADQSNHPGTGGSKTSVHLMVSADRGDTWQYRCPIAIDDRVGFNETWLHETDQGDIVAFVRTADASGMTPNVVARSRNHGQSFEPWQNTGFHGHPHGAARLPDGRVLLTYGYRKAPFGIRARLLDSECSNVADTPEFVLRDDGGSTDLGYPWPLVFPDGRVLVTYYINHDGDLPPLAAADVPAGEGGMRSEGTTAHGGIRYIAGTWLEP